MSDGMHHDADIEAPVATLRRAAALMRERADAATPGPWVCYGDHLVWPSDRGPATNDPIMGMIGPAHDDTAEHIASWHPAVALAVADWLDEAAESWRLGTDFSTDALAVARAYLNTPEGDR